MESKSQSSGERLPIKVILPKQGTEKKNIAGGGPHLPFRLVDQKYRGSLSRQVLSIQETSTRQLQETGVIPMRVKLLAKGGAKSHRPIHLFSEQSCPIIGVGAFGELFLRADEPGLDSLNKMILDGDSKLMIKELSCVEAIEPITPSYRCQGMEAIDILRYSPRRAKGFVTRVRLFNFGSETAQQRVVSNFKSTCERLGVQVNDGDYSDSSYTYRLQCTDARQIDQLAAIGGVRAINAMPLIRTVRPTALNGKVLPKMPVRGPSTGDFPVVVVVDSGVSRKNPDLESWVVGEQSDVAPAYRNPGHGSFVAGLICWGAKLNPTLDGIDENPCGVFDLQVIPNNDPDFGDTQDLLETELLGSLESALAQYANKYKVWNLSLGTDSVCSLDEFSPLAEQLDNLQEKYKVSFVISAGNYDTPPLLDYPRSAAQLQVGRITAPADSVLGITVGAISHIGYRAGGPRQKEPSAFSRHGAGPNHIIKPDVVHYGGTCNRDASHIAGIRSVTESGSGEDLGTSFATPLVSRTLAQIYHYITPTPSPVLARALLTHHARDPRTNHRVQDGEENYMGFGMPSTVPTCLECNPHTSTLIFEDTLRPGYFLEWDHFPYPPSLHKDGRYYGEIWMTVALEPARGSRWGTEYCETHIEANFGVYHAQKSRKTGISKLVFKGLVPPEHKNPGMLYESYQVENLRKWAPVRTHYGLLDENGEKGERWRLKLRLLTRHGVEDTEAFGPQRFALIVTIADPLKTGKVYDEMAQIIRSRFQAQNLTIRPGIQIQGRGGSS